MNQKELDHAVRAKMYERRLWASQHVLDETYVDKVFLRPTIARPQLLKESAMRQISQGLTFADLEKEFTR